MLNWILVRYGPGTKATLLSYLGDWATKRRIECLLDSPQLLWGIDNMSYTFPVNRDREDIATCVQFFGIEWHTTNGEWDIDSGKYVPPEACIKSYGGHTIINCDAWA